MVRFIALAAVSAALIAGPAAAQEYRVTVSTAGKSEAQLQADLTDAARKVCRAATATESFRLSAYGRCVAATLEDALKQI